MIEDDDMEIDPDLISGSLAMGAAIRRFSEDLTWIPWTDEDMARTSIVLNLLNLPLVEFKDRKEKTTVWDVVEEVALEKGNSVEEIAIMLRRGLVRMSDNREGIPALDPSKTTILDKANIYTIAFIMGFLINLKQNPMPATKGAYEMYREVMTPGPGYTVASLSYELFSFLNHFGMQTERILPEGTVEGTLDRLFKNSEDVSAGE